MSKVAWPEGAATAARLAKRDGVFRICKLNQTTPTRVVKKKRPKLAPEVGLLGLPSSHIPAAQVLRVRHWAFVRPSDVRHALSDEQGHPAAAHSQSDSLSERKICTLHCRPRVRVPRKVLNGYSRERTMMPLANAAHCNGWPLNAAREELLRDIGELLRFNGEMTKWHS
jgi:hypothetical protein